MEPSSFGDARTRVAAPGRAAMTAPGERWYVVQTQAHGEGRAAANLARQGYALFCPRRRKTVRHARRSATTLEPLFPNYLFVRLDVTRDHWRSVNGTRGVMRLIAQRERPEPVPAGIVEALQSRMGEDGVLEWAQALETGQAVRISSGPFADFVGMIEHLDTAGRVRVLLEILGRSVSVALHREALMPAA